MAFRKVAGLKNVLGDVELRESQALKRNASNWVPNTQASSNITKSLDSLHNASSRESLYSAIDEQDEDILKDSRNSWFLDKDTPVIYTEVLETPNKTSADKTNQIYSKPKSKKPKVSTDTRKNETRREQNERSLDSNSNSKFRGDNPKNTAITTKMAHHDPKPDYGDTSRSFVEVEADYGQTMKKSVEENPDYGDSVRPPTRAVPNGGVPASAGKKKKVIGGVPLFPGMGEASSQDWDTGAHQSQPLERRSDPDKDRKRTQRQKEAKTSYAPSVPAEDMKDLSKLSELSEETINECLKSRYSKNLIYTRCGDILISVNPFQNLGIYTPQTMDRYSPTSVSSEPHLYQISARAYQDLRDNTRDQVILVSGESGAGKTEATKLLVKHVIQMAGSESPVLQDTIIQVNPLLENFGNASTVLNTNSSRFAKYLKLVFNQQGKVQSGKIQDFMLEKSRVVHCGRGETTFHSFYAMLSGFENLKSLYIEEGQTFRITGNFSPRNSRHAEMYREKYKQQQKVFELLQMKEAEIEDVHVIMAAILHIGDITFEDVKNDCVIIKDEKTIQKVANLLDLDATKLTEALIQRKGKIGKGEVISYSKKKHQAEDERDSLAKTLYERLFGWLVRKINEALAPTSFKQAGSIGILDICGFENLERNSFEQLCINVMNEHLQNFMNTKIIADERQLYLDEGIPLSDIDTSQVNNDDIINLFMKTSGMLDSIDECCKVEILAKDSKMMEALNKNFGKSPRYEIFSGSSAVFAIEHFAGKVRYDARGFIEKNRDSLSEFMQDCLKASNSLLVKDLFHVTPFITGTISMSQFNFQGSRRGGAGVPSNYKPLTDTSLSDTINQALRKSRKSRFGSKAPEIKSDLSNKKTHIFYFKNSLKALENNVFNAVPYFVRCIKPNKDMHPESYIEPLVVRQLRYNGITEIARIRSCGLPVRMGRSDFVHRYGDLVSNAQKDHIQQIMDSVSAQPHTYKIGTSQVFMTRDIQHFLEEDLTQLRRKEEEERRRKEEEERRKKQEETERLKRLEKLKEKTRAKKSDSVDAPTGKTVNFKETVIIESSESNSSLYASTATELAEVESISMQDNEEDDEGDDDDDEGWKDTFHELEEEEFHEDMNNLKTLKVIKLFLYIFLALVLLTALTVQKVSFVVLAMNIGDASNQVGSNGLTADDKKTVAYFFLIIAITIPYAVNFLLALLKLTFSISKSPSLLTWVWVLLTEFLHVTGLCLLVFRVMRDLDIFTAVYIMSATAIFPALFKVLTCDRHDELSPEEKERSMFGRFRLVIGWIFDFIAFAFQGVSIWLIYYLKFYNRDLERHHILELVGGLVMVNANQWENFADGTLFWKELNDESWFKNKILKIRYELQECRYFPNTVASFLKIGLAILIAYLLRDGISLDFDEVSDKVSLYATAAKSVSAIIALTISGFVAFIISILALKLDMKSFSFAVPLVLATPLTVLVFYLDCDHQFLETVSNSVISGSSGDCTDRMLGDSNYDIYLGAAWFVSLLILCRHIRKNPGDKHSNLIRLFMNPNYSGILTTEQLMMNCRRHEGKVNLHFKFKDQEIDIKSVWYKIERLTVSNMYEEASADPILDRADEFGEDIEAGVPEQPPMMENNPDDLRPKHITPKVFACATFWHETRQEMTQLLKSIHRLDRDQLLRKLLQKPDQYDPNYYEFEAHILFDDAMELEEGNLRVPNKWVKDLVASMTDACSSVYGKPMKVHDPIKMPTPYGGQLIWRMPGDNLLFVHLKDLTKIRNRKRWSQVMYMYYLLDYRLKMCAKQEALEQMEEENRKNDFQGLNIEHLNIFLGEEHSAMSNKTFVLALDGDTDFNPSSLQILMQRMADETVGAACGRIHPIGNGPMVWYQKFEYAIGHWLQKSAEHVFGCVLCSPGCFSLFRARALMDTNVVKRYTTDPEEPAHLLQYDQGEDRWLCTLLLQRGYRIEYAAGADAWTFAPEGFFEFFNQRRRWMPSTIANIMDLLATARQTRQINANISLPYIMYTWFLMLMTLLGPGTILMMIAGAFQLILTADLVDAYLMAVVPAAVFVIACFWLKSHWQLLFAGALSILYVFIMIVVLVGTIITASSENIFHPSVIIMVLLLGIFMLTGLFHPKEWTCLLHGVLYILAVPSGYLLLVIYSICNLNDVSWGTREVLTKAQKAELAEKNKRKEEEKKNKKGLFQKLFDRRDGQFAEMITAMRSLYPQNTEETKGSSKVLDSLHRIEKILQGKTPGEDEVVVVVEDKPTKKDKDATDVAKKTPPAADPPESMPAATKRKDTPEEESSWTKDESLGSGEIITANKDEIKFWNGLIKKYLFPRRPTKDEKKRVSEGLKDLRNRAAFAFTMINGLWMGLNFMFQYTEAAKVTLTYKFGSSSYQVEESILGLSFVFVLVILLLLQFGAMLIHRMGTLQQLLSTTRLWGKNDSTEMKEAAKTDETIRFIQMMLRIPSSADPGAVTNPPEVAAPDDPLGRSVKNGDGNSQGIPVPDYERSMRTMGRILDASLANNAFVDRHSRRALAEVRKRLDGTKRRDELLNEIGRSFRPGLPPRPGQARQSFMHNRMATQTNDWGITAKEVRKLRPGKQIIDSPRHVDNGQQYQGMGALVRSVYQRAQVVHEEEARLRAQNVDWQEADVGRREGRYSKHRARGNSKQYAARPVHHY